jgi:hypothetical protein
MKRDNMKLTRKSLQKDIKGLKQKESKLENNSKKIK